MGANYGEGEMPPRPSEFRYWAESPFCPRFIEKLLLAIIDAHPLVAKKKGTAALERARQIRLSAALKALFGVERDKAIHREAYDLPKLMLIAQHRLWRQRYREYQEDLKECDEELTEVEAIQAIMKRMSGRTKWSSDLDAEYVRLTNKIRRRKVSGVCARRA